MCFYNIFFVSIKFIYRFAEINQLKHTTMKTLAIAKTVKPARICQNYKHWKQYIKQAVQTIKNKQ